MQHIVVNYLTMQSLHSRLTNKGFVIVLVFLMIFILVLILYKITAVSNKCELAVHESACPVAFSLE